MTQFVSSRDSRKNCSTGLMSNDINNSDNLSILYSKTLREWRKPEYKVADAVGISKFDLPFKKGYQPSFTQEVFEIVAIFSRKHTTFTMKDEQDEIIRGKLYRKELIEFNWKWILLPDSWFQTQMRNCFQTIHSALLQIFLPEQLNLENEWEAAISKKIPPIHVSKCHKRKIHVVWQETFKVFSALLPETWSLPFF